MPAISPRLAALSLVLAAFAPAVPAQDKVAAQPADPPIVGNPPAPPAEVKIGGPAPKLEIDKWVKGTPVESLDKGIYVVEMWATWCGPCIRNIPHLTALQKEYKDQVRVIGVSIWEESVPVEQGTYLERVEKFVAEMGDRMDYAVAYGGSPAPMSTTWMMASAQAGIPCAFLIKDGKVQWFGHPVGLDRALKRVLDGSWDLKSAADQHAKEVEKARLIRNLVAKATAANEAGDTATVNKLIDELIELAPDEFSYDFQTRAEDILTAQGEAAWYDYTRKMTSGALRNDPRSLNFVAWSILNDEKIKTRDAELAHDLASRAVRMSNEQSASYLITLASAHWARKDGAKAAEFQEKALKVLRPSEEPRRAELQQTLERYKAGTK